MTSQSCYKKKIGIITTKLIILTSTIRLIRVLFAFKKYLHWQTHTHKIVYIFTYKHPNQKCCLTQEGEQNKIAKFKNSIKQM
jgi:hypothetical protein